MDNDVKKLIIVAGIAAVIIAITKPKGLFKAKGKGKNLTAPKVADSSDKEFENSITAIKAMRAAINDKVDNAGLDDLNKEIAADYKLKVYLDDATGKLFTKNASGNIIAKES